MQSTEQHRHDHEREAEPDDVGWLVAGGRGVSRLAALLLWVFVGSYSRYHPVGIAPYTVGLVGGAIGVALLAALVGVGSDTATGRRVLSEGPVRGVWHRVPNKARSHSAWGRLLLVGCIVSIGTGTVGILASVGAVTTSQLVVSEPTLGAGAVVVSSLIVLVDRWAGRRTAGFVVGGLAVGWLTLSTSEMLETLVFGPTGIYGPLTRAAAVWIAPGCLLVGLWRSTGTTNWLQTVVPTITQDDRANSQWVDSSSTQWRLGRRVTHGLWQVTPPSMGWTAVLIAWLSVGVSYRTVLAVAAIPAAGCWFGVIVGSRSAGIPFQLDRGPAVDREMWRGPLVMAGGPLILMAVLLVGLQLPVGTVLLAGGLLTLGFCVAGPMCGLQGDDDTTGKPRFRTGFGTVLDGSVIGMQLFARIAVLLAAVGGVVRVLQASGASTWLLSSLLWLSDGNMILVGVALVVCCVLVGMALPMLAGYAVGALLVVPLLGTLIGMPELIAHLLVWYAVVGGWVGSSVDGRWLR